MSKKIVIIHELNDDAHPLDVWETMADSFGFFRKALKPIMNNSTVALIEEENDGVNVIIIKTKSFTICKANKKK